MRTFDVTGQRFGRLTVLCRTVSDPYKWLCRCDCGGVRVTSAGFLRAKRVLSCGCARRDHCRSGPNTIHGEGGRRKTTTEYEIWKGMKARCSNPKHTGYSRYGARGISVCARWRDSYEAFLADMGRRPSGKHSIDRINNEGNYEPSNCRWATASEQRRNQRPRSPSGSAQTHARAS